MKYGLFSNIKFLYFYLWKTNKKIILFQLLEIFFSTLTPVILVLIPPLILNLLETYVTFETLLLSCFGLFLLFSPISALKTYLVDRNSKQYIEFRNQAFQNEYLNKQFSIPFSVWESEYFQTLYYKGLISLCNNSIGLEDLLCRFPQLITEIFGLIIFCLMLSNLNPLFILILLGFAILQYLFFIPASTYESRIRDQYLSKLEKTSEYFQILKSNHVSAKDIRIFELQPWLLDKFNDYSVAHNQYTKKIRNRYFSVDFIASVLHLLRDLLCYGYLIIQLKNGLDPSLFILYIGVILGISSWFDKITLSLSNIRNDSSLLKDTRIVLDYPDAETTTGEHLQSTDSFHIVFNHVSFSYPNTNKIILDDISFEIEANQNIAIVGINGAGKSTIVKLLCGFYKPSKGQILINGQDITTLNMDHYQSLISCIFQDTHHLSFTIAENIACATMYNQQQLNKVIEQAELLEKVNSLYNKEYTYLDNHIDPNGVSLSGGEFQKLMLARALYKGGSLFLLDEPTAALDAITENKIYEQYKTLTNKATSIFISHRLSSTKFCDQILVLNEGHIIEQGTHADLIKLNNFYANLFNIQSQYYQEGSENNEVQTSFS